MSVTPPVMRFCNDGHSVISCSWQISTEMAPASSSRPQMFRCQLFREGAFCSVKFFATCNSPRGTAGTAQRHKAGEYRFEQLALVLAQADVVLGLGHGPGESSTECLLQSRCRSPPRCSGCRVRPSPDLESSAKAGTSLM